MAEKTTEDDKYIGRPVTVNKALIFSMFLKTLSIGTHQITKGAECKFYWQD